MSCMKPVMPVTLAIASKDVLVYFGTPTAYIVAMVFMLVTGVGFVGDLGEPFPEASLSNFFRGNVLEGKMFCAALVLIPLAPVLTMRLLAEERKLGTIELLLTAPVLDWEVILGKYLASLVFLVFMLSLTGYYVVLLVAFGSPDVGPIYSGYVGIVLFGMVALSVGIFASCVTSNQIVAAVLGMAVMGLLYGTSLVGEVVPGTFGDVLVHLGMAGGLDDFVEGVIDSANVVYFVSLVCLFLFLAVRVLESRRWR